MRNVASIVSALGLMVVVGCGGSEGATTTEGASVQPAPAPAPAPAPEKKEPPKQAVEDTSFRLALQNDPSYGAGKPSTVRLVLEARGGYHVNQDYPIRVDLRAPAAVKLTKATLEKADAAQFGEESARFDVGFSAEPGAHELLADVDFAVCTKETCVPESAHIGSGPHRSVKPKWALRTRRRGVSVGCTVA